MILFCSGEGMYLDVLGYRFGINITLCYVGV